MRPEKFNNLMNNAIEEWLKNHSTLKMQELLPEMKRMWEDWAQEESDYRNGMETYGYSSVVFQMGYIADRWRCAFRLKWLIDGIESGAFEESNVIAQES